MERTSVAGQFLWLVGGFTAAAPANLWLFQTDEIGDRTGFDADLF